MNLPNVTLIGISGTEDRAAGVDVVRALQFSSRDIDFGEIVFLSPDSTGVPDGIVHKTIAPMTWPEYNDFMLFELTNHVNTDFVITVQADGCILNPHLWQPAFLEYDYIGAPWSYDLHRGPNAASYIGAKAYAWLSDDVKSKSRDETNLVGNGGFSFRSKKLLDATAECPHPNGGGPEDVYICTNHYDYFVERGIRFAPYKLAAMFALNIDMYPDSTFIRQRIFGFHGDPNLIGDLN